MLPSGTSGQESGPQRAKNWHEDCETEQKGKKKVKFGTFLISSLAPEPLGYIRFTFSSLFSVRRMTRNPHLADEGRAPRAFCGWGTWQDLWSSSPFDF